MATRKKINTKKVKKQVKKAYKKNPKVFVAMLFIMLLLCVGGLFYLYTNGYLDAYFKDKPSPNIPRDRIYEQDENGFYYYSLEGYEVGDYYYRAKDLVGDALANELHTIIREGFNPISYGDARYVLAFSDRDPLNNNESVRGIYDNDVIATYWIGDGEGEWQREHVWPNSKLGIPRVDNNTKNQGSDLHNLRAITGINQTRSNRYFASGSGQATKNGAEGFYPGDDHKGDVARILFYMAIMYDELTLTNDTSKLEDNSDTNYTLAGAYAGLLDLLIQWHKEDPVDAFEIQRNEFIYGGIATNPNGKAINPQGNRNPFIDKPELVHLIWENKQIEELIKPEPEEPQESNNLASIIPLTITTIQVTYYVEFTHKNKWFA